MNTTLRFSHILFHELWMPYTDFYPYVSYLILADGVLFQQVLITATNFEDVFTLIFLNTHLKLLWGQQHAACLLTNGLCYHL